MKQISEELLAGILRATKTSHDIHLPDCHCDRIPRLEKWLRRCGELIRINRRKFQEERLRADRLQMLYGALFTIKKQVDKLQYGSENLKSWQDTPSESGGEMCEWKKVERGYGVMLYKTPHDEAFMSKRYAGQTHCPYCGKPIKED